ncbi:MAG TPA: FAD-dependent oxidoreductase [Terriglobales bacterium]|nr:FAD-dependent oxidoreductase [Terriglobales bacterium]
MRFTINGTPIDVPDGHSLAAEALARGIPTRRSVSGESRGPLCGMGVCFECRATVDGVAHQLACQTFAGAPPAPVPHLATDLLIVGAGPAGLAAAAAASANGTGVTIVDDNPTPGGQIWRGGNPPIPNRVQFLPLTRVVDAPQPGELTAIRAGAIVRLRYKRLLLATGARERFLPFPGWTLPHVLGAGGLQALVKAGLPIAGKRIVIAGTGPLLVAVAAYMRDHGASILALCDQASARDQAKFLAQLPFSKWGQGLALARSLRGVRPRAGTWPIAAAPGSVTLNTGRTLPCDYVAVGYHLVPNTELAQLLGCATQNGFVVVNDRQQTTVADVYCAGEPTAIGGIDLAQAEGELAGLAIARAAVPHALLERREQFRRFAERLARVTELRPELRQLPKPETIICRCEDVTQSQLAGASGARGEAAQGPAPMNDWRAAKLHTRCGMGPCQGRTCAPILEFLYGFAPPPPRPPIFPAPIATLEESLP